MPGVALRVARRHRKLDRGVGRREVARPAMVEAVVEDVARAKGRMGVNPMLVGVAPQPTPAPTRPQPVRFGPLSIRSRNSRGDRSRATYSQRADHILPGV